MTSLTLEQMLKRTVETDTGCLEWQQYVTPGGYGRTTKNRRPYYAHRLAYELAVGPIPDGRQIDHLCRNRRCVNPSHLEVVSPAINTMRGESFAATNARKTHCRRGHEYREGSYWVSKPHGRICKECVKINSKAPSVKAWRSKYYKARAARILEQMKEQP